MPASPSIGQTLNTDQINSLGWTPSNVAGGTAGALARTMNPGSKYYQTPTGGYELVGSGGQVLKNYQTPSDAGGTFGSIGPILDNPIVDIAAQFTPAAPIFDTVKAAYDVSQKNYLGAALSAYGAYEVPSGGFDLPGSTGSAGSSAASLPTTGADGSSAVNFPGANYGNVGGTSLADNLSANGATPVSSIGFGDTSTATSGMGGGTGISMPSIPGSNAPISTLAPDLSASGSSVAPPAGSTAAAVAPKATGLQGVVDGLLQPKNILPAIGAVGSFIGASNAKSAAGGSGGATAPLAGVQAEQQNLSNTLLSQYQSGTLTAADAYKVDQWEAQQIASTKQYYASAGLGNSDMLTKALGDVSSQAAALRSTAQNQYLTEAISALGGAGSTAGALVTANVAQDTNLLNAQNAFFSNLSRLSTTTDTQGAATP